MGSGGTNRCLESLPHDAEVNSALFSPADGNKLLTTDEVKNLSTDTENYKRYLIRMYAC
jgi:hypothetical protein